LREIVAELRGLRADLARRHSSGPAGSQCDERASVLLKAIAEEVGDGLFSSRELVQHAEVVGGPLRAALTALNATTPRRLGKRLEAIEGREFGGWAIQRLGADAAGVIWKCIPVSL
jgi:hypothetical protein